MTLSLALTTAALLAAEPNNLPAGHPPLGSEPPSPAAASSGLPAGQVPEGHPPMTGRAPPTAEQLLQQLDGMQGLREREKTFEIASSLGKLYYTNGRPADAIPYFLQAEEKGKGARELFLAQRKKLGRTPVPSAEAANCGFKPGMPVEEMAAAAQARAKKGDSAMEPPFPLGS